MSKNMVGISSKIQQKYTVSLSSIFSTYITCKSLLLSVKKGDGLKCLCWLQLATIRDESTFRDEMQYIFLEKTSSS